MAKKEIFLCDNCGKTSIDLTESSELPYIQGWRYLNDFEFKASTPFRHQIISPLMMNVWKDILLSLKKCVQKIR